MAVSEKLKKKLLKRKAAIKSGGGGDYIIFKEGTTRFRPLYCGEEDFACEVVQFYLGPNIKGVISPATFGEPCAIMEAYNELKAGDEDDQELAKTFRPRRRFYTPAIRYNDEKGKDVDSTPRLAILTGEMYDTMIDMILDEDKGDFTDPKEGYDLKVKRTGSGQFDTEYKIFDAKPSPLPVKELAKKVFDPEEMVRKIMATYEETQANIEEFLGLSKGDDDDDEAPRRRKKKPTSDMDEAPKKRRKKKPTASDEAPKKKKRVKK